MKNYEAELRALGKNVTYISALDGASDIRVIGELLNDKKVDIIHVIDPTDDWLMKRLKNAIGDRQVHIYEDCQFVNTIDELSHFFRPDKTSFFQTTFYKQQRKKHTILLEESGEPSGGKWTFDTDNRKKYPKGKIPPPIVFPAKNEHWSEAVNYVQLHFPTNPGSLNEERYYPITHSEAKSWLTDFLTNRFHDFGIYEDAIVKEESILHHSVLSPLINSGLLAPQDVIETALSYACEHNIPINSTEGFIRQIIGWREFIRGMYIAKGVESRNANFWQFHHPMPHQFYDGTTGIAPIDNVIKKILRTGYCHHIERLMVVGNFMLLCEIHPNVVYKWFMELFIDAYDWVMVPNVYGMSQFADGGFFATKPYICGSNYIRKMSNFKSGEWTDIWDGLFWRFIGTNEKVFSANPRMKMMVSMYHRMAEDKKSKLLNKASDFLETLHGNTR